MTAKDLLTEIERLPLDERLYLLEALTHNIRESIQSTSLSRVLGMLKGDGEIPTDEQVKQDYLDYLDEKYA